MLSRLVLSISRASRSFHIASEATGSAFGKCQIAEHAPARRCRVCHEKQRQRRECTDCHEDPAATELYRGRYRCEFCLRLAKMHHQGLVQFNFSADAQDISRLTLRMLAIIHLIDIWILPTGECPYIHIRIILYTEFGIFAGLLRGPFPTISSGRSEFGSGYHPDLKQISDHILGLVQEGLWPEFPAKVVCCGFSQHKLELLKERLPAGIASQLVAFPVSLTHQPNSNGWPDLTAKARQVLELANVPQRRGIALSSRAAKRFLQYLYP